MRPPTACQFCRSRRRRCEGSADGRPCALCVRYNVLCVVPPTSKAASAPKGRPSARQRPDGPPRSALSSSLLSPDGPGQHVPLPTAAASLPPQALRVHLASLYFDYIHDQLHSLFQRPTFTAELVEEKTPPVIMYAIMALSARFSENSYFASTDPRSRGAPYASRASELLNLRDLSVPTIQACVLLGAISITEGDAAGESVYYGVACRMAQLMDLPNRWCETRLERETNLRIWHTLCMIDEWSSTGLHIPKQISDPPLHLPLPMDEMRFLQLRREDCFTPDSGSAPGSSLLAQMITLNRVFRDINTLNEQAVSASVTSPDAQAVGRLCERLESWQLALPRYMRDEPSNMAHYASLGLGRIFVAVYLGYYHFGQLLNYQFLHQDSWDSTSEPNLFAQRCKYNAERLCKMVYAALDTPGCDVLYNMVGHVLVIASTVQIHTLLFSLDDSEIAAARKRLERNFEILLRLRNLWPTLDVCMTRLRVFHKACRASMNTSFKLDRWMLKFLSEFAKPIDDKQTSQPDEAAWTIEDLAISPDAMYSVDALMV